MFFGHHRQPTAVLILKDCVDFASKIMFGEIKKFPVGKQRGKAIIYCFDLLA